MKKTNSTLKPSNTLLISSLLVSVSFPIVAQADSIDDIISDFGAGASVYSDKNGISIKDWSVDYTRGYKNNINWKLGAHYHDVSETGKYAYHGNEVIGQITKEFNDYIKGELSIGAIHLENQGTHQHTNFTKYNAKITAQPTKNASITVEHGENLLFQEAIIEDDNKHLVSGKTTKLSGSWRAAKRIIVEGSTQYRELSDGNTSRQNRAAVLYGISPDVPWVWAGVEAQSLSYDDTKNNYWSPEDYEAYAVVLSTNFPINKKLSLSAGGNINRTKEKGYDWASGGTVTVGANYALSKNTSIKAEASYLESTRGNDSWNGNKVGISFVVSDF